MRRLVHVALAACAGGLAAFSLRTVGAEQAFEDGLARAADAETDPAADLPGRVEAYEEAARLDPGESLYALRAAQIRLARARRLAGPAAREQLAAAERLLDGAAAARPLDADVHAARAVALRLRRDAAASVAEARAAILLAPWGLVALGTAQSVGLWAWRAERDPAYLRMALSAGARLDAWDRRESRRAFDDAFAAAGPSLAADLVEATAGEPALRAFAAASAARTRPEVAALVAGEGGDGR
jgi:hypothetical protein